MNFNFRGKKVKTLDAWEKKYVTQLHVGVKSVPGDRGERHEIKWSERKKDTVALFPTVSPCAPPYLNVGDRPFGLKTMNATVEVKNKNCSSLTWRKLEFCGFHFSSGLPCQVFKILKQTCHIRNTTKLAFRAVSLLSLWVKWVNF